MQAAVITCLRETIRAIYDRDITPVLTHPEPQFGDLSTNAALPLAKQLGKDPREVAQSLADVLTNLEEVQAATVAGPGFINIRVTDQALVDSWSLETEQYYRHQVVVVEYSDPNPFKVLHAGHLYTTLVGDSIARLFAVAGGTVHRVNFGGDVGLHVGKTMWAILQELGGENPEKLSDVEPGKRLDWLSSRYVRGNEAYEDDEQAKAEITKLNKRVYQLHEENDHESPFAKIYWMCRQWSYEGFDALYEQLGVAPFEKYYPESMTTPRGIEVVRDGLARGVFEASDGAVVFKGEEKGLHTRVFLTSDGLPTYETKDLGLALHKWDDYQFDRNVIITGNDIVEYMKVVLAALANFHPQAAERTTHLTHGQVKLTGGVKMSSRKGNILRAVDILEAARAAHTERNQATDERVSLGAIKYAFLKQRIGGDIIYDPAESVSLQGNSGPYLQYAHARACSIIGKSDIQPDKLNDVRLDPSERSLAQKLSEYPVVLSEAARELSPHSVAAYLFDLAQDFNRFYENSRIIGDPREGLRLALVVRYRDTLQRGLTLLGIAAPDRL